MHPRLWHPGILHLGASTVQLLALDVWLGAEFPRRDFPPIPQGCFPLDVALAGHSDDGGPYRLRGQVRKNDP